MKIKNIKKRKSKELTVDIEVDGHVYQLSNGWVSHNTSQLTGTASGIHPRWSPYYLRSVRVSAVDPICKYLKDKGVPWKPENTQTIENHNTAVFSFPIKSPKKAIFRTDKTAIQQLKHWKIFQEFWCDHKPSITVYIRDHEWLSVGAWVYENWDILSGVSFLPYDNGIYQLAPYVEIDEDEYLEKIKEFPKNLNFSELFNFEKEDYTIGGSEKACSSADGCELF